MDVFGKEAARITGIVMAVLVAILSLLGVVLTPEDYEALGVIVTAGIGIFITMGGAEFIRNKVASRKTLKNQLGDEAVQEVFGAEADFTQDRVDELEDKVDEILLYLQANK